MSSRTARETLQVNPLGDQWAVVQHPRLSTKLFSTKREAEDCAFQLAMRHRPSEVSVSADQGEPGYRRIFGNSGDFQNAFRRPDLKPTQDETVSYLYGRSACRPSPLLLACPEPETIG
jgi:hypothetical protein